MRVTKILKELGLYVHIPFCASKCMYCNFNSYAGCVHLAPDYLRELISEIKSYSNNAKSYQVTTIFIGGGTPSIMPSGAIATIIKTIKANYKVVDDAEITIEANPNTITFDKAHEWISCGINRVSVGLQSVNGHTLKVIGRTHTLHDYKNAVAILKQVGFTNINTDIMLGLPGQKQSHVKSAINLIHKLGCTHISAYALILEQGTPLYELVNNGLVKLPSETKTLNMYNFAYMYLHKLGYIRYEVSNFAYPGYECKHNLNTWSMVEYLGFGAGAHSYFKNERHSNYDDIKEYIHSKSKIETSEKIDKQEKLEEYIMLGLRKVSGINLDEIRHDFGIDLRVDKAQNIEKLLNFGLIKIKGNMLYATDYGFTLLNKVILELV